ncbi:MarR family winged helix-turn-helix transcriptional regulator [Variovorax terrae]|uniref:MarR family winged helix-turn-helix transcriptional regulator n=1 Tax=Variovorax terrae TaxID=2923278 RepID=A0A9X2APG5_9BURK|nr:MarR family winged helix-turn-helix transcriptional regulator [Variovorax terrae]MCJ0763477.1 MarR family winged helix-turn-helix transcriptional regulator [Variovorax terrae]
MARQSGKPAAAPPLDQFLTYRLHLVSKLTDKHSSDAYAAEMGLPVGEARCLAAIGSFAPLSVNLLAAKANLDKGQASRAAQALVERGLLRKQASEVDGRGVVLTLTRSGQALWSRVMQLIARRNEDIFGCLSAAERQQLGRMLDCLIEHARR